MSAAADAGWRIVPLDGSDDTVERAAELLVEGFRDLAPHAWPDLDGARAEVREALSPERFAFAARTEDGRVGGWIGAIPEYDGRVWEVHPLVVGAALRRRGIGRALIEAVDAEAARRGGLTLWVGTDDETGLTSLGGVDLYPDPLAHAADLRDVGGHPFAFYRRVGFAVAGVVPDANGFGRPDILMARRVGTAGAAG